jgi:hypothetical protein
MRRGVAVAYSVACGQQHPALTDVNPKIALGLVLGPAIDCDAADKITEAPSAKAACECHHLERRMRVLPVSTFALRSEEEKGSIFVHVMFINELRWSLALDFLLALGAFLGECALDLLDL